MQNNKITCFIVVYNQQTYIIPQKLKDDFEANFYHDERLFEKFILPDEAIMEDIDVDEYELRTLVEGGFS